MAQLVQRFYHYCIPNALVPSDRLFLGLPSQITCTGFVWPRVMPSARRLLRRPGRQVGMDAPCRTGTPLFFFSHGFSSNNDRGRRALTAHTHTHT